MEIKITNKLKKIDSELIQHLITIPNENNTITIDNKYFDIFCFIKKNKKINIDFSDIKYTNYNRNI